VFCYCIIIEECYQVDGPKIGNWKNPADPTQRRLAFTDW